MNSGNTRFGAICLVFVSLSAAPLFAQASFSVSSATGTAADIGVTELTGVIVLTVSSGTTAAAPIQVHYTAAITNNSPSEIQVTGTGGLSGVASSPVVDAANSLVRINVPEGGVPFDQLRISGVRVAVANQGFSSVTATITSPVPNGNTILAGQGTVTVISSIRQPFTLSFDPNSIKLQNLTEGSAASTITIAEGFPTAFSSAVGTFGQTTPTKIRFTPFPSIPQGVKITFARAATSMETGAVLATESGQDETVPRADGSTEVIYVYTAAMSSGTVIESFPVGVTVTVTPPAGTGTIAFQATLLPIGLAVPNAEFPSTDIPRYIEREVPDETDLLTGTVRLDFPFLSQDQSQVYTGIALTNPIPFRVKVSLSAFDTQGNLISGPGITNPVNLIMPRSGQLSKLAGELFGQGFNSSTPGTIVATCKTSAMPGFYLEAGSVAGQGLDGATSDLTPSMRWVWPSLAHQGPSATTTLRMFNPGTSPASAALNLYDASGDLKASAKVTVPPGGVQLLDAHTAFSSVDLSTISGGYVTGTSNAGVVPSEVFGNNEDFNVLRGQAAITRPVFIVPHFVAGGGYTTELNLVNMDSSVIGRLTLTAFDGTGAVTGGGPVDIMILPGNQYIQTVDRIFPSLAGPMTTGYIRIDVATSYLGPWVTEPPLVGSVRFTSAGGIGTTALPILNPPSANFVYSHVAQNSGYYTGIALINQNAAAANVSVQVFTPEGSSVGEASIQLQPGQKTAELLYQIVPASAGQVGGYVRVQSTLPISSYSVFGTLDGKLLSAIPLQSISQ